MTIVYWLVAAMLALFYVYSGGVKVLRNREQLRPMMRWVDTVPTWGIRAVGVLEMLGAVGLILPPLTGIAPVLALVAAVGLVVLQLFAGSLRLARRETKDLWLNGVLPVLAVIAAWSATAF